jgi:UrcA family protein
MNTYRLKSLSVISAAALILTPIAGICAEPVQQVRVAIGDVNLSNPQGIAMLYTRLKQAAAAVCGDEPQIGDLSLHAAWSKCVGTALDEAVVQVRSIGLAALHAKHVGRPSLLVVANSGPEAR